MSQNLEDYRVYNFSENQAERLKATSNFPPYTAESLYGSSELTAPEGWEFTGEFRKGLIGETILLTTLRASYPLLLDSVEGPRLILRKKPNLLDEKLRLYGKDYKIPVGYKEVAFRVPQNDLALLLNGEIYPNATHNAGHGPRIILEKLPLRKRYIFEETGEESRPLKSNEYGRHTTTNQIYQQPETVGYISAYRYKPLTLKIEEF